MLQCRIVDVEHVLGRALCPEIRANYDERMVTPLRPALLQTGLDK